AAGLVAAIGDIRRFASPQKLVSYLGLNPRVRQSGLGLAQHGRISEVGRSHARAMLVDAAWAAAKQLVPCAPSSYASALAAAFRLLPLQSHANLLSCVGICSPSRVTTSGRARLGGQQEAQPRIAGGATGEEGKPARIGLRLQRQSPLVDLQAAINRFWTA